MMHLLVVQMNTAKALFKQSAIMNGQQRRTDSRQSSSLYNSLERHGPFIWRYGKLWHHTDPLRVITSLAHSCDQKNAWRRNPSLTLYLIGGVFFFEISLFSKSLTRLPQAQITANVCSLTQPKMAFKYLNLLIIRNQLTVHSNRSLSKGLQTIWGAKTDVSEIWTTNVNQVLEVSI